MTKAANESTSPLRTTGRTTAVADAFERAEVRLDVAELDTVAVQLHLVIAPAIEEHQAVLDVPDVAGPGTRAAR